MISQQQVMKTSNINTARLLNELSSFTKVPKEGTTYSTHGIHPYAAKFIPQLPDKIIEECSNERHTILDPFCGSGTTLLEARLKGRCSVGFDVNPIAFLVSKVKTTQMSKEDWDEVDIAISRIKSKFECKDYSEVWIPEIPRIEHWFQKNVCMDLGLIAGEIRKIENPKARNLLEVAFSSIIVTVSNQESETRFAAIKKNLAHDVVENSFIHKVRNISEKVRLVSISFLPKTERLTTHVFLADARKMIEYIPEHSIDLVITSPPYLNSYDYYLYHKFRIYWLGFDEEITDIYNVQKMELGSRYKYSGKNGESIDTFRNEMLDCFFEVARVTKLGKLIFILIGDSVVRDQFIEMDKFYQEICKEVGMDFIAKTSYPLREISRSFKAQNNGSRRDYNKFQHILVLQNRSSNNITLNKTLMSNVNNIESTKVDLITEHIPKIVANGSNLLITNNKVVMHTHGLLKYPSKFIPDVPRWAIENYSEEGDLILDPFIGCGTSMVEARLLGRNSIGLDVNPVAVLASNVKANPIRVEKLQSGLGKIIENINKNNNFTLPEFPLHEFWFDKKVLEKLAVLYSAICQEDDIVIRDFFLLVLGNIIKPCSYWDEAQIKVERDQRKLLQGVPDPYLLFNKKAVAAINTMKEFYVSAALKNVFSTAYICDSTKIPGYLKQQNRTYRLNQVDLIVTSPPYINAINYPMFNRYELFLLDLINHEDYINHQRFYLGTERVYSHEYSKIDDIIFKNNSFEKLNQKLQEIYMLEPKRAYIVKRYFEGMRKSIGEMHRLLKKNGKLVFVVGSNNIKGVYIPTYDIIRQCAEEIGFKTINVFSYQIRNHRFKIKRHETGNQINIDNIVVMERI